jgi:DNA-binding XRE family transcriptional regulator
MKRRGLIELRKKAGMTQAEIAESLGISVRTIATWETEDPDKDLGIPEAGALRELFQPRIFDSVLQKMGQQAFEAIPSEIVSIWLVTGSRLILLASASRYQDLEKKTAREIYTAECVAPLVIESLTTYPLRTGETLNLAGEAIIQHPAKKFKANRASTFTHDGICESLIHAPAFTPSARGPHPVLLLSLENKINEQGQVIKAKSGQTVIYTEKDRIIAEELAKEFRDRLLPDMILLDMMEF